MTIEEVRLPELGESVEEGYVAAVLVKVGEAVTVDQPLLTIETGKAVVDLPSPVAGVVREILVQEDETINVGHLLLRVESNGAGPAAAADVVDEKPEPAETPKVESPSERVAAPPSAAAPKPVKAVPAVEAPAIVAHASPSVRRLAREIGVDIAQVTGTGPRGRISMDDVKRAARSMQADGSSAMTAATPLPDFGRWGETERRPMSAIRRVTAESTSRAWQTIPHVTQCDKADVTEAEAFRKQHGSQVAALGAKLTMTAILLKVCGAALRTFPKFNASLDTAKREIVHKNYVHIGVAVDTEHGLLVPVIRDVERKTIVELAAELGDLAERARQRRLTPDEMEGGNFSISNLGGIGGTAFTPIVLPPQVAILGVSRSAIEPVLLDGEFQPRQMLPLSLSYDHRVIDGADGARFLRWICRALEQPLLLALGT